MAIMADEVGRALLKICPTMKIISNIKFYSFSCAWSFPHSSPCFSRLLTTTKISVNFDQNINELYEQMYVTNSYQVLKYLFFPNKISLCDFICTETFLNTPIKQ